MARAIKKAMSEATLTKQCIAWMKQLKKDGYRIEWLKVHGSGMQRAGEPDLSIVYFGRAIKVELKAPGKQPTPLQLHRLATWAAAGARTAVIDNIEDFRELLT